VEQYRPPPTVAIAADVWVGVALATVVFGAAAVFPTVVVALVVGAAAAVVGFAAVVSGTMTEAGAGGGVAIVGLAVVALGVVVAMVGLADELTLAWGSLGTSVVGAEVSGFAIAPTAPRLITPPATMPILTFQLSAFQRPGRRVAPSDVGTRYGGRGLFMLGGFDMRPLHRTSAQELTEVYGIVPGPSITTLPAREPPCVNADRILISGHRDPHRR
jgi:hypothetical protein